MPDDPPGGRVAYLSAIRERERRQEGFISFAPTQTTQRTPETHWRARSAGMPLFGSGVEGDSRGVIGAALRLSLWERSFPSQYVAVLSLSDLSFPSLPFAATGAWLVG